MAHSRLSCGVTMEQIDAYFSIVKPVPETKTTPGLVFNGRSLDPATGKPFDGASEEVTSFSNRDKCISMEGSGAAYNFDDGESVTDTYSTVTGGDMAQLELDTMADLSIMPNLDEQNVQDPPDLEVYNHYNFNHKYDETLPVHKHRQEIIETIDASRVTIIQGATGSGKTTQVPQFILDSYKEKNKYCNIVVTQPRRIAATSIAKRVCHERNWQIGRLVGYQVGLDKMTSEDTRIAYVTVGVLLRQLVINKHMRNYTHVIVDEVHERDQDTDFVLLIVRQLLRHNSDAVKVILMSATFDTHQFARYFLQPVLEQGQEAPTVSILGQYYKVTEFFLDDLFEFGVEFDMDLMNPNISEKMLEMAIKLINHFDELEKKDAKKEGHSASLPKSRGAVLVFLPGLSFIQELELLLENCRVDKRLHIVPLHSSITLEEQVQVFTLPKPYVRKVILSTNIAESSLTVPDVKYVIDFCLTKSMICDLQTNYQSLRLQWASKANGIQRKGRAGRVSNGQVYRLVSRRFWDNCMSDYGIPEMQRCPLENVILQVKLMNLGEPKSILSLALSPPSLNNIERTILLLKEVGAISTIGRTCRQKHDGDLTFVGRVLAALPLDMRLGKLLLLGYVFGCLENCIVIAASLSSGSFLAKPYHQTLEAYMHRLKWANGSFSDCMAFLMAYRAWEKAVNNQMFRRRRDEYEWCRKNFLQSRRLHEVHLLVKELTSRLLSFNIRSYDQDYWQKDDFDDCELILKIVMAGAFYPNYFYHTNVDEKSALKDLCELDPTRTVMLTRLPSGKGPLYSESLKSALKHCGKLKALYYDNCKAFAEFCDEEGDDIYTGNTLPSVYAACKMRDCGKKLQIFQSHSETRKTEHLLRVPFLFDPISMLEFKTEIPGPGGQVWTSIQITHICSANRFWGCKAGEPHFTTQQKLFRNIQEVAKDAEVYTSGVEPNTLVLTSFFDGSDYSFYRGLVISRIGANAKVFFVDYGNTQAHVKVQDMRKISSELASVPFQAIEFELAHIRIFKSKSKIEGKKYLETLLHESSYRGIVKVYSVVSKKARVDLFSLIDSHINQSLVDAGFAEVCEEGGLSKLSHGKWELAEHNNIKSEEEYNCFVKPDWRRVPSEGRGPAIPHSQRRNPAVLFGPASPFEMRFYSVINIGQLRQTRVERDGINSVAINQNPNSDIKSLMVAASVGINESGSVMLARNTTLFPEIRGLPYLVAMIFTPVLELRCDKNRMRFTGAICGLGGAKGRIGTYSVLPEHDMELEFDAKITVDDIVSINSLRMSINMTVGSNEEIVSWSQSAIHRMQRKARKQLLQFIKRPRLAMPPESFTKPFKWGTVDQRYILPHAITHHSADRKDLYRLHDAISLIDSNNIDL